MQQGSAEWHAWRKDGIGASEVAAIMGCSPYTTAYQLWREKREDVSGQEDNTAMARGRAHEPMVRAALAFEMECEFTPQCFEHPTYPFLRASLDAWCEARRLGAEIKSVGAAKLADEIPRHHYLQVQTQMLVTASLSWLYVRTADGVNVKIETIHASPDTQAEILAACTEFWRCVQDGTPPPYQPMDWVPCESVRPAVEAWRADPKRGRAALLAACAGRKRTICAGVKISTDPPRISEVANA